MAKIIIYLINLYQKTISPDHGAVKGLRPFGYCKYYPSCSEYTKQSVKKYGMLGLLKGLYRVVRCNPWASGGIDLA